MVMLLSEFFIRVWGIGKTFRGCPLSFPGALSQELCMSLCLLRCPGPHTPQDSLVLALGSDYTATPPCTTHHLLFLCFLSVPEEDPCDCESIVKFQAKVEGLLQALTRKHILSQRPLWGGRGGALWGGEGAILLVQWGWGRLVLACLLLKTGCILAR